MDMHYIFPTSVNGTIRYHITSLLYFACHNWKPRSYQVFEMPQMNHYTPLLYNKQAYNRLNECLPECCNTPIEQHLLHE